MVERKPYKRKSFYNLPGFGYDSICIGGNSQKKKIGT